MPPKGSWRPSVNLSTLLTTVRLLIATPNADDGLMPDITNLYKTNPKKFAAKARQYTLSHAMKNNIGQGPLRAESNNAVIENKDTGNIKNESATDVTASSNVGEKLSRSLKKRISTKSLKRNQKRKTQRKKRKSHH